MISAVVAVDKNWGIGYQGELLERLPEDMAYFRELTENNIVIMGRKTWESLPGILPHRENVVISSKLYFEEGYPYVCSMEHVKESLGYYLFEQEIFIIGGGQVYKELLPYCDRVYVTKILKDHKDVDTYFPNLDKDPNWETSTCTELRESVNGIPYAFLTYERIS